MRRAMGLLLAVAAASGCVTETVAQTPPVNQPEEYGAVHWGRDFAAALATSRQSGKPVFLLFTEVPGCSTVRGFANGPLSHPLLVEAIEDEFVPVVVRNNVGGKERAILEAFGEPAWNNPIVRFIDANEKDLAPRYGSPRTPASLAAAMVAALEGAGRPVPAYLRSLVAELGADRQTTVLSMYCFWTGEVRLAGLAGVLSTRPGFANGREVVEVTWDRRRTTLDALLRQAASANAASGVLATSQGEARVAREHFDDVVRLNGSVRYSEKDDKYQIRGTRWSRLSLTPAQATALNRAATVSPDAVATVLSPRQLARVGQ